MEDGWGVEQGEGEGGWVLGGRGGRVLLLLKWVTVAESV